MRIFVDESGSFIAPAAPIKRDSWCVIASYVSPESDQDRLDTLMAGLRADCGGGGEVKIHEISEARYIRWLRDLGRLSGVAFAVAADVSLHDQATVQSHREEQARSIVRHVGRLIHEKPKVQLQQLSSEFLALPLQLYTQLQFQVQLFHRVIQGTTLYYAQFKPETLGRFTWRVDQKDIAITKYEDAFKRILSGILQTISLGDPLIQLKGANYEHLKRFEFSELDRPTYLRDEYGLADSGDGLNLGMIIHEDFQFVDSSVTTGVQVADLLASGLSRLLRGKWEREHEIALGLGSVFLRDLRGAAPIGLLSLAGDAGVSPLTERRLAVLGSNCRPMLNLRPAKV